MIEMPFVDPRKCNGCGLCVSVCHCNALKLVDNVITICETDKCGWCAQCEAACPLGAISCAYEIVCEED